MRKKNILISIVAIELFVVFKKILELKKKTKKMIGGFFIVLSRTSKKLPKIVKTHWPAIHQLPILINFLII